MTDIVTASGSHATNVSRKYKLSAAVSIIYATAKQHNAVLWTIDQHFYGLPNVRYFRQNTTITQSDCGSASMDFTSQTEWTDNFHSGANRADLRRPQTLRHNPPRENECNLENDNDFRKDANRERVQKPLRE